MSGCLLPPRILWEDIVRRGLREDLGGAGDLTTDAIVPADLRARAHIVTRQPGVVAGLPIAAAVFELLDPEACLEPKVADGERVAAGAVLAVVEGPARALLSGERTALNLIARISGIATATRRLVDAIGRTPPRVVGTRKTTPGLRVLEKYAVRAGGGSSHRFGLDDAVLIKDNHVAVAGDLAEAVERVRSLVGHTVKIEVEVDTLEQLEQALELRVEAVLLDNMEPEQLRQATRLCRDRAITEASGGITEERAREIADSGVDLLSVGWLTHSAPALDVGLDWKS